MEPFERISEMPEGYMQEAAEQGTLREISYSSRMLDTGEDVTRKAMVFLPFGYDPRNSYDIMYLIHGRGGTYRTWLGTPQKPRAFKNVLDNMILDGRIDPMIVVTPGLNYQYGGDRKIMRGISHEIAEELMPAVESVYSTYAQTATPGGFILSRDHRMVAGFSMGGSATWHILKDHVGYFRYFIPMSMAMYYDRHGYSERKSKAAAQRIREGLERSGYSPGDYEVYAATGTADHKSVAIKEQVYDLVDDRRFRLTETGFQNGNIMLKVWPDRWHRYTQSIPYLYDALVEFYRGGPRQK